MKVLKIFSKSAGAALLLSSVAATSVALAGPKQDEQDALAGCAKSFEAEIGSGNYVVVERKYGKLGRDADGNFGFLLNAIDKNPALPKPVEYRAYCLSGGFAKLQSVDVTSGRWAFNSKIPADRRVAANVSATGR